MIDVVILNRNLGDVCDRLVEDLSHRDPPPRRIWVIDAGSRPSGMSSHTSLTVQEPGVQRSGLRFSRGMNIGLSEALHDPHRSPWILLLPVDSEIVRWDFESLLAFVENRPHIVAIKPWDGFSPLLSGDGNGTTFVTWTVDEGPWLLKLSFVEEQMLRRNGAFFDPDNFRGMYTSLELALRAFGCGYAVAATSSLIIQENETHLLQQADLIETEPLSLNQALLVTEGREWLGRRFGLADGWDLANIVRLLCEDFLEKHPEYCLPGGGLDED